VVWFVTNQGIARIDPREIVRNPLPPPVAFRTVIADDQSYSPQGEIALPPLTRNLRIEYTALSLVLPERVRFRHRLEGWEDVWHEAGDRREVTYTDLRPGRYALRVAASNNDGVWNETGAALHFTVAPAWFQTTWFRALVVAILLASLVAAYRYRVRRIAAALNARFDERLAERTRIARELHDTMLQTVQGSKLVADDALASDDAARMRHAMERLSAWLGQAVDEGRGAVTSLRESTVTVNALAEALRAAAEDSPKRASLGVSVSVRGTPRDLHPIVRDEIYRIAYEAIRNACAHSEATTLAIELEYAHDLVLRITDNGRGIDPAVAVSGKPGRFGLSGMRERATNISATLTVDGTPTGTCVTLVVPGPSVFRSDPALHHSRRR
jgi:signal transduction histidine kinase